ncbi:MAG: sulfate adenylyltransferase [Acidilobus sp.]
MVAPPHGGRLVDRVARGARAERLIHEAYELPVVEIRASLAYDVANVAHGVYSPLEGFLTEEDYESVLRSSRLATDVPWTIPIVLDVDAPLAKGVLGGEVALSLNGTRFAIMDVEDSYRWDRKEFAERVYGVFDPEHPGVAATMTRGGDTLIGGRVEQFAPLPEPFEKYRLWPKETRVLFERLGWRTIAAFQTRNAPHLGHEFVMKSALTFVDGLFVNPLVGWKKSGDFSDEAIVRAYESLLMNYFPRGSYVFSVLRASMHYAGPKEAIHHAIMRKNFGATHFIVGRDHAGVGKYYGSYDAWRAFEEFPDLGVTPLFLREFFYCTKCGAVVNDKICPHDEGSRIRISGTEIRKVLAEGSMPPPYMMRPEVAQALLSIRDRMFTTS